MRKYLFLCALISVFSYLLPINLFAQGALDKVIEPLEDWASKHPQEKVYIHTDKPYYLAGDTIWMKAYAVIGGQHLLSALSGAVYIDLINETDSLIKTIKLPLMSGMAKGNIELSNELEQGNYRLRAYTQWMRNAGPDYFYDQTFLIGSIAKSVAKPKVSFDYGVDKGKTKVNATISFLTTDGKPMVGNQIKYRVQSSADLLQWGKEKTDNLGNISIALKPPTDPDSVTTFIVSEIETGKRTWERHVFPIKSTFEESDVQFFPEGGDLVADLPTRVAFKAIGQDGLGLGVKGEVVNQAGDVVAEFDSQHAGMGFFSLSPEAGANYEAVISFPDHSKKTFKLPAVKSDGYVLTAYPRANKDSLLLRVLSSKSFYKPVSILAQQNGHVLYAADLEINDALTSLHVPTSNFSSGIVQVTLFDENGQPLNERLVFVERPDQLQLDIKLDQAKYGVRSPISLDISALNQSGAPVNGNFSIAVIDETGMSLKEESESSILSHLLLRSELKGYIEKPNYYFENIDDEKRDQLDILMMTQGYRRFNWDDLMSNKIAPPEFEAEKLTSDISGRLLTLLGKPVENGKITLISLGANTVLDTVTDKDGRFKFDNLLYAGDVKFTIQGRSARNSNKVEILLDMIPGMRITPNKNIGDLNISIQDSIGDYLADNELNDEKRKELGLGSRAIVLEAVVIKGKTPEKTSANLNPSGHADQTISANELTACPTLRMCLEGRLQGVRFQSENTSIGPVNFPVTTRGGGKMLVAIDSRILRPGDDGDLMDLAGLFDQNMIDPSSILSIEVLRSPSLTSIYGPEGENGVIIVNTKGWEPGVRTDYSIKHHTQQGFSQVREFYSPKYGISDELDGEADLRSTIYWNPALTSQEGKASVSYFNAGKPASYRIVIEGISNEGKLGRKVVRYKIE